MRAFFKSDFFQGLWTGLIPSLIAVWFVITGLDQTTEQIRVLQEQISYVRKPVLVVSPTPPSLSAEPDYTGMLTVSNVGNEPAENVFLKFHLMLVSDTSIFSFGQREHPQAYFTDTARSPREKLWPRLTIYPDSQEISLGPRITSMLVGAYHYKPDSLDIRQEIINLRLKFGGIYVLFMESLYRRQSDLVLFADTSFFQLEPLSWWLESLQDRIGGPAIQERIKTYLFNGPQISINLEQDHYEIYRHYIDFREVRPEEIRIIKR